MSAAWVEPRACDILPLLGVSIRRLDLSAHFCNLGKRRGGDAGRLLNLHFLFAGRGNAHRKMTARQCLAGSAGET